MKLHWQQMNCTSVGIKLVASDNQLTSVKIQTG